MRRLGIVWLVMLSLTLLTAACGPAPDPADDATPPPTSDGADVEPGQDADQEPAQKDDADSDGRQDAAARPASKEVTITIEGTPEKKTAHLFTAPEGWPLAFSTYYPDDWLAETAESDEGNELRFVTAYGGKRDDRAFLSVFVYPEGTSEEDALALARGVAENYGISELPAADRAYPWSLVEYAGVDPVVTRLAVGRHGQHFFHVLTAYPGDFGDGFAPRAGLVLREWIWTDTGEPLDSGRAPDQ